MVCLAYYSPSVSKSISVAIPGLEIATKIYDNSWTIAPNRNKKPTIGFSYLLKMLITTKISKSANKMKAMIKHKSE